MLIFIKLMVIFWTNLVDCDSAFVGGNFELHCTILT